MSEPPTESSPSFQDGAAETAGVQSSSGAPAHSDTAVHALSQYGLIRASGPDASSFLQGQLTSDVTELDADRAQLSAWCTPQGRVLATLLVWRDERDVLLMLPAELVMPVAQRLSRYVLRAKVKLAPADDLALIGLSGPGLRNVLPEPDRQDALEPMRVRVIDAGRCVVLRDDLAILALARDAAQHTWQRLSSSLVQSDPRNWDLRRVHAGLPMITAATQDAFVPQMLNLERLDAVSFSKGCYPGQEIVARAQYRGEVKRRLYRAVLPAGAQAATGDTIITPAGSGTVIDAVPAPGGGLALLVVLPTAAAAVDAGPLTLSTPEGPALTVLH